MNIKITSAQPRDHILTFKQYLQLQDCKKKTLENSSSKIALKILSDWWGLCTWNRAAQLAILSRFLTRRCHLHTGWHHLCLWMKTSRSERYSLSLHFTIFANTGWQLSLRSTTFSIKSTRGEEIPSSLFRHRNRWHYAADAAAICRKLRLGSGLQDRS